MVKSLTPQTFDSKYDLTVYTVYNDCMKGIPTERGLMLYEYLLL